MKRADGASCEADLLQHTQCHKGVGGHMRMETAQRSSLWLGPVPASDFSPWQKAFSGESNGTEAEQKLHSSSVMYSQME